MTRRYQQRKPPSGKPVVTRTPQGITVQTPRRTVTVTYPTRARTSKPKKPSPVRTAAAAVRRTTVQASRQEFAGHHTAAHTAIQTARKAGTKGKALRKVVHAQRKIVRSERREMRQEVGTARRTYRKTVRSARRKRS